MRYTRDTGRLDLLRRRFYETYGYLVISKLIPQDILEKCSRRFDDIAGGRISKGSITVMKDVVDRKSVNKVQDIHQDPVFSEYIQHPDLLNIVENITGPNILAVHSMLIAKPPDVGKGSSRHPAHQDLWYFPFRPADRVVAAWTAIEPCDTENGCLFVAPGTHTLDRLYPHGYPPDTEPGTINKFYHGILDLPESNNFLDLKMDPGDTVFFHPLLVHGSGVNVSNRTRKAISCHYAAAECEYINVQNTVQEPIQKEILETVRKRFPGVELEYTDIWRFKSTLVRGIRSTL